MLFDEANNKVFESLTALVLDVVDLVRGEVVRVVEVEEVLQRGRGYHRRPRAPVERIARGCKRASKH